MTDTQAYKGYTISIMQDENPESPREWDNLGGMVCFHKRYDLGDKHNFDSVEEFHKSVRPGDVVLPLYLYDHGGITISTTSFNDTWDSGQIGFIICRRETYLKEFSRTNSSQVLRDKVRKILKGEVKVYDQYLTGDVWGYSITAPNGEDKDRCWGYYGQEDAIEEAKSTINYYIKADMEQKVLHTKAMIKNQVPLMYR